MEDYKKFGDLMLISAFRYENQSGMLKKMIKNNNNPLVTVQKRLPVPSLKTDIIPRFAVGRNGFVIIDDEKFGQCLGIVKALTDESLLVDLVPLANNVKPLSDGDEFLVELCHRFFVFRINKFKLKIRWRGCAIKIGRIQHKAVCYVLGQDLFLLGMSSHLSF